MVGCVKKSLDYHAGAPEPIGVIKPVCSLLYSVVVISQCISAGPSEYVRSLTAHL